MQLPDYSQNLFSNWVIQVIIKGLNLKFSQLTRLLSQEQKLNKNKLHFSVKKNDRLDTEWNLARIWSSGTKTGSVCFIL
jgi:hypothetical protein